MSKPVVLATGDSGWASSYACANFLLKQGASILWATRPFTAVARKGACKELERGSFLITEAGSDEGVDWIAAARTRFEVELLQVEAVEGFEGLRLQPLRIAVYGGGGGPYNHARIYTKLGFEADFVSPREIKSGKLADFDVLIVPGGGMLAMQGQLDPLGEEGCLAIAEFVRDGGMYMGFCAGAFDAAIVSDSFMAVCPQQRALRLINAAVWNSSDTEWVGLQPPGVGVIKARNLRPEHPVMAGLPERFPITHYNGPLFEAVPGAIEGASDAVGLTAVAEFTDDFTPAEYYLRFSQYDRAEAKQNSLISRAAREGRFNIVAGGYGLGRVVLSGSHPEFGSNLLGDKWGLAARILANAAFWQAGHLAQPRLPSYAAAPGTPISFPAGSGLEAVSRRTEAVLGTVQRVRERSKGTKPDWLRDELAMSIFGLSGVQIWERGLAAFDDVAKEVERTLSHHKELVQEAGRLVEALRVGGGSTELGLADALDAAVLALEEVIHFRVPEEWHQDFGYEGVLQILDRMEAMVQAADDNFDVILEPSSNPYQHFESNPFQLMVGVYLAALGLFAHVWYLLEIHEVRISELVFRGRTVLGAD